MIRERLSAAVARSVILLAGRRVLIMAMTAVGTALVARFLGPSDFGQLASALAALTLANAAADFGFSLVLGRELSAAESDRGALLRAAVQAQTAWSFAVALVVVGLALWSGLDSVRGQAMLIFVPAIALSGLTGARQVFLVLYKTERLAFMDVTTNVLQVTAMIGVAAAGTGAVGVATTVTFGSVLNIIVVAIAGYRLVGRGKPGRALRASVVRQAAPLGVGSFLSSAYTSIDLVLLGWLVAGAQLGAYAAAVKAFSLITVLPGLVMAAALPGVSSARRDRSELSALVGRVSHWLAVAALPVCVGVIVFADPLVELAFGSDYEGAVPIVRVFGLAGVLSMLASLVDMLMVAESMARPMMLKNIAALVFNVAGNLLLVPKFGVIASAWVTVGTEALVCAVGIVLLRGRLKPRSAVRVAVLPALAVGVAALAGLALTDLPIVGMATYAACFLGAVVLLRAWPEEFRLARPTTASQ